MKYLKIKHLAFIFCIAVVIFLPRSLLSVSAEAEYAYHDYENEYQNCGGYEDRIDCGNCCHDFDLNLSDKSHRITTNGDGGICCKSLAQNKQVTKKGNR